MERGNPYVRYLRSFFEMFGPSFNVKPRFNREPSHPIVGQAHVPNSFGYLHVTMNIIKGGRSIGTNEDEVSVVMC